MNHFVDIKIIKKSCYRANLACRPHDKNYMSVNINNTYLLLYYFKIFNYETA